MTRHDSHETQFWNLTLIVASLSIQNFPDMMHVHGDAV